MPKSKEPKFENNLKRLEQIVEQLEKISSDSSAYAKINVPCAVK